jgi:hypothetical protein
MRWVRCLVILWLISGLAICCSSSKQGETPAGYEPTVVLEDGLRILINPDFPKEGRFNLGLTEELSLGEEEEEDVAVLNRPIDVRSAADGTIYVMDWGDILLKVYGADGSFLRTIGRKGQGPGEFDAPSYFDMTPDGHICLLDSRSRRIEIFDPSGDLVRDFRLEGFNTWIKCDAGGWLYFARETRGEEEKVLNKWQELPVLTSIFRVSAKEGEPQLVGDFSGKVVRIMKTGEESTMSVGSAFDIVWLVGRDGRLFAGFNKDYRLGVYSPEGELLFKFGREHTPVENPRFKQGATHRYLPAFHWASVMDEDDNLWLNLYDEDEESVTYDVFSPEGIYLRQVKSPVRIFSFNGGRIYSILRPEDGFPSVKRFAYTLEEPN